jgi:ketosteroid isomerase-like protein
MSDAPDPTATVRSYAAAFNKGDVEAMAALFDTLGSILDGLPPHVWQGPTACEDWYRMAMEAGEHEGAEAYHIILDEPKHVNVTGDAAYVVAPASMSFRVHGRQITQVGATYTIALRKSSGGWRIRAWAWAKGTPA